MRGEGRLGPLPATRSASAGAEAPSLELVATGSLQGHIAGVWWGAWATVDGRPILATGGSDDTVRLWDPATNTPLGPPLTGHTGGVRWGAWATVDGRPILATGGNDDTVRLWDPATNTPLGPPLTGHTGPVWWGAWATVDGRPILATGGSDDTVRLWDPATNTPLGPPLTGHTGGVWSGGVWSGAWATVDGRPILATGGGDGTVRLWDPATNTPLGPPLTGHTRTVGWGAWATVDGRPILATGGGDDTVRLWDPATNTPLGPPLTGHTRTVRWGAWATVDGRPILATGGSDDTVRLWDPATNTPLGPPLTGHTRPARWGAWATVDGRPILAAGGNDDGAVRLWEVREVRVEARRRTGYRSDDSAARDELDRTIEAASLAELVVARSVAPPLAVGVFGDWGSGKSVFLRLLAQQVQIAAGRGDDLSHDAVRQVWFNAWHYAETDLWASLVAEIFGQLAAPSPDQPGVDAGTLQRQQSRLAAELIGRRKVAERLAAARSRRDALRRARAPRRWKVLPTDQREELSAAVTAVDPALAAQGAALYDAACGAQPWLRVRLLQLRRIWRALPRWVWGALLLIVAGGISAAILLQPRISAFLGGVGLLGLIGTVVAARTAIRDARETVTKAIEAIKKISEGQHRQVDTAVKVADQEVTALERQLQDLTAAGALTGLASDRAAAGNYRHNLGLMTQIREDFQQMAVLLARAEQDRHLRNATRSNPPITPGDGERAADDLLDEAGDTLPRIDRIVLYIDDLDRCPPNRVVAVLEAVHLLLAIPLFVVVVAVDPRWLRQAVDVHYQAMLHPTTHPTMPRPSRNSGTKSPGNAWARFWLAGLIVPMRSGGRWGCAVSGLEFGDVRVEGGSVDPDEAGDGGYGFLADQFGGYADLVGGHDRGPAQFLASCSGGVEAFVGAFDDELADEFGEGGEYVKDQSPTWCGGIELFVQGSEPDLATAQVGDDRDQVLQGAAESGQLGDYESVAFE